MTTWLPRQAPPGIIATRPEFWDPVKSAAAAASFAALLAAIVLSIVVQLGVSRPRESPSHWQTTRRLAPVCLVTLLTAAYMFVLLAGMPSVGPAPVDSSSLPALLGIVQHPSYLFGIAGSVLAVGALAALALLLVMFREGRGARDEDGGQVDQGVVRSATVTLTAGALAAATFLLFGYDDIFRVFTMTGHFSPQLWVLHILGLFLPIAAAHVLTGAFGDDDTRWRGACLPQWLVRHGTRLAGVWLFLVPTMFFVIASHFVYPASSLPAGISTFLFAVWSGLSLGGLLAFARGACAQPRAAASGGKAGKESE